MHKLIDFTDGTLRTPEWLARQPKGTIATIVQPKNDSGADDMFIAKAAGRDGRDCLCVQSTTEAQGLPGFWLAPYQSTGRATANITTEQGYLIPRGHKANRFSFWCRFNKGFRAASSALAPINLIVGTYHYDPALLGKGPVKESNNWHFYHQLVVRHDQAQDNWVRIVVNDLPQHQRGNSSDFPVVNPTQPAGEYWQLATRLYIDCHPYVGKPEIPYPVQMWVDDITFDYVAPPRELAASLKVSSQLIPRGKTTTVVAELTNTSAKPISGIISHRSRYSWTPALVNPVTNKSVHNQRVTLEPGTTIFHLQLTPRETAKPGTTLQHGLMFIPDDQARPGNHSLADPNVVITRAHACGPCDCSPVAAAVRLTME